MILSTAILVIFLGAFINGKERGLISILLSTVTYFCGWFLAHLAAKPLGSALATLLPTISSSSSTTSTITTTTNQFFYNGIAFMLIFWGTSFVGRWFLRSTRFLKKVPVVGGLNALAGGLLNVLIGYLIVFLLLFCLQALPITWWQTQLVESGLAQLIIKKTPGLAAAALQWLS